MNTHSAFAQQFADTFARLDRDNLHLLEQIYSEDLHFSDPLHELHGLSAMRHYCEALYANVNLISFEFQQCHELTQDQAVLRWIMTYQHPRLAGGRPIQVPGCSFIEYHDLRVHRHADYYDAGALLYEHVPLLGRVIRYLKARLI